MPANNANFLFQFQHHKILFGYWSAATAIVLVQVQIEDFFRAWNIPKFTVAAYCTTTLDAWQRHSKHLFCSTWASCRLPCLRCSFSSTLETLCCTLLLSLSPPTSENCQLSHLLHCFFLFLRFACRRDIDLKKTIKGTNFQKRMPLFCCSWCCPYYA